jgi:hypothetical protein
VDPKGPAFASVVRATTAFFDRYLKHEGVAESHLRQATQVHVTKLALALHAGDKVVVPLPRSRAAKLRAVVQPTSGLVDGQQLVVSWQGYQPGQSVNVLQCSPPLTGAQSCNLSTAHVGLANPGGSGTTLFTVHTGPVGAGICDGTHPACVIVVNQAGSSSPSSSVLVPITFAP